MAAAAPRHFPVFDALRGYAILGVLVVHSSHAFAAHMTKQNLELFRWASFGRFGVQLFYMVSACTLFWSMASRTSADRRPLPAFFLRRLFRIAPLFWSAIAVYAILCAGHYRVPGTIDGSLGPMELISSALFFHGGHPNWINSIVPGGWSIAVEMPFYLLVPLSFAYIKTLRHALRFFAAMLWLSLIANSLLLWGLSRVYPGKTAAELPVTVQNYMEYWLPTQLPVFALGFVLYFLVADRLRHRHADPGSIPPTLRPAPDYVFLWAMLAYAAYSFYRWNGLLFVAPLSAAIPLLVFAWMLIWWPTKVLVNRAIEHLGKISYSVYLWHLLVMQVLLAYLGPQINTIRDSRGWVRYAILLVLLIAGSTIVGTISYYLIEKPMMALGKKVIDRLGLGPAPRTPAAPSPVHVSL